MLRGPGCAITDLTGNVEAAVPELMVKSTGLARLDPWMRTMMLVFAANAVPVLAVAPPPVTLYAKSAPVVPAETLPSKAVDTRSPAVT